MYLEVGGTELEKVLILGSTSRERRLMVGDKLAMFVEMIEEMEKEMFVGDGEGDVCRRWRRLLNPKSAGMDRGSDRMDTAERSGVCSIVSWTRDL